MKKILLINMPFGGLDRQAIGISLLKAHLQKIGISCEIKYLNFRFAEYIGCEEYYWISNDIPHTAFVGEWVFTDALYGRNPQNEIKYIKEILQDEWKLSNNLINRILDIKEIVPHFMDYCLSTISWNEYAIVGFTSTFEQNIASLGLAKRIKSKYPGIKIVFGGANWESEMGIELHRNFPYVDYVCSGEADISFPLLVKYILKKPRSNLSLSKIKGIVYRNNGRSIYTGMSDLVHDMDQLPVPDYADYFNDFYETSANDAIVPNLLFESSRGCWWGNKLQCTFCGLNGKTICFRSKSAKRIIFELNYLSDKWNMEMFQAVDNVIDMNYFKSVFPVLAEQNQSWNFFYEIRPNLNRKEFQILSSAGVNNVQPGIESLNNHVLKLMRKGTTALKNVQFLKWCKEYGINASWNVLYGFPGETKEDYIKMMEILTYMIHLDPPTGWGPIRLDRFSPYYNSPSKFGITNLTHLSSYKYLYPFSSDILNKIAYYFNFDYDPEVDPSGFANEIIEYILNWKKYPEKGTLKALEKQDDTLCLNDNRSVAVKPNFTLNGIDKEVYQYCDSVRSSGSVMKHIRTKYPQSTFSEQQISKFLNALVKNKLMVTDGKCYLSLALN